MYYVDNATMVASLKRSTGSTPIATATDLHQMFTTSQINKLVDRYLGVKLDAKMNRLTRARKVHPAIESALVEVAEAVGLDDVKPKRSTKRTDGLRSGPRRYVIKVVDYLPEKLAPQCQKIAEILSNHAGCGQREVTKSEILEMLDAGGFKCPNPWNNLQFYRRKLIELGVMEPGVVRHGSSDGVEVEQVGVADA